MTDHKLHATWGPIPAGVPEGNDELEALGARSRNYLSHSDGRWHLGVPTELDYVPYAPTVLERNRRAIARELALGPIAHRRRRTPAITRALAWLDAPVRPEHPMTRLAAGLAIAVGVFGAFALVHYATH